MTDKAMTPKIAQHTRYATQNSSMARPRRHGRLLSPVWRTPASAAGPIIAMAMRHQLGRLSAAVTSAAVECSGDALIVIPGIDGSAGLADVVVLPPLSQPAPERARITQAPPTTVD